MSNRYDHDALGNRIKDLYERPETERRALPYIPLYARLDGRSFSKLTRKMQRPFCSSFHESMQSVTALLIKETNALVGYTQSDEISLLWLQTDLSVPLVFDGKFQKIASTLASSAAAEFGQHFGLDEHRGQRPTFDCRVYSLPSRGEAANVMLWRELDATKNAVSMAARTFATPKQLHGLKGPAMQELMFQAGQNFNDYPEEFRRGSWMRRETYTKSAKDHNGVPVVAERHRIARFSMPPFSQVTNRIGVLFDGEAPEVADAGAGKA